LDTTGEIFEPFAKINLKTTCMHLTRKQKLKASCNFS